MLSLRYLCWMRRNLSFCFRSVRCWVVGKWGSKWLVWLVKFPTYSNGQMSLEIPSKYGFIDGFSIVVGGDTPSLSRQTLSPWDDSGFHPRWTTRLFWTLDIFFSCITGVVGILRVGVRQLVDRWKFSGGCVVGCLDTSWNTSWWLENDPCCLKFHRSHELPTTGPMVGWGKWMHQYQGPWYHESPSERHLPRWRQMDQWSMTSRSSCGLDLVGQNSRNVVATNSQVLRCYRCHGSFIQPKEQVQEGECDVSQGKFVNSSLTSS